MKLMLSCKEATALMEKSHHVALSSSEKRRLRFHNFICKVCKQYQIQSQQIENLLQKYLKNQATPITPTQIEALKKQIKSNLNN
jgi:predicted phage-related endonuclease